MALLLIRCWEDSETSVSIYTIQFFNTDIRGFPSIIEAIKWFTWEMNQAFAEERMFKLQSIGNLCKHLSVCIILVDKLKCIKFLNMPRLLLEHKRSS